MMGLHVSIETIFICQHVLTSVLLKETDFSQIPVIDDLTLALLVDCEISSSCALCDTYKPIKAKCAVFERAGEVKSRMSLMPNCSH